MFMYNVHTYVICTCVNVYLPSSDCNTDKGRPLLHHRDLLIAFHSLVFKVFTNTKSLHALLFNVCKNYRELATKLHTKSHPRHSGCDKHRRCSNSRNRM